MITALLLFAAFTSLTLGFLVLLQQVRVLSVIFFFLTMLSTALWSIGIAIFLTASDEILLFTMAEVYYIAAASIACFTLLFSVTFANEKTLSFTKMIGILTPFLLIAFALASNPGLLLSNVQVSENANTAHLNPSVYLVYIVYFAVYYFGALVILWQRSRTSIATLRKHFKYIFIAYGSAGFIGMLFNLFLPAFGNYQLIWAGPLGLLIFVPIVYLAIAKYGLFDIRQTVVRTVAYIFSLIVLSAIYYLLAYIVSTTLFGGEVSSTVSISPINIFLALLLAFIFQPIKAFFDKLTNSIFYRDKYNSEDFFARLSEVLTTTTDLRGLLERASNEIGVTLKTQQAFFFVQYNHTHHISSGTKGHTFLPLKDAHALSEHIKTTGERIIITALRPEGDLIHKLLVSHKIALLMPLMKGTSVLGYLALGDQMTNGFTNRDLKVLATISDELVIAVQNALSVQEVKDINIHLQQRIDSATAELRSSNAQLRHLDVTQLIQPQE